MCVCMPPCKLKPEGMHILAAVEHVTQVVPVFLRDDTLSKLNSYAC